MGVPAFFRWLSKKYPSIVVYCNEEKPSVVDGNGEDVPVDLTQANPNNIEFDNLYLDMNGIIHPCTHPEDKAAPDTEEQMFIAIFDYIDRIMSVVRPRKLLYMAVDGVAPRAKLNQQRSRRFRAAQEARITAETMSSVREELMLQGRTVLPQKPPKERFDSNCITPGTPFMHRLALALRFYVHYKLHFDKGWENLQVILSDASVPGEGEHKVMDFIRKQRGMPDHDPNTKHCLCGADADLIMLGLATHEPHFVIIREEFKPNQPKPCPLCGLPEHTLEECKGLCPGASISSPPPTEPSTFIFIRLDVLREYLARDLLMPGLPFPYDFERAIDDWVLMCFFVGNDFLPHLPSLQIAEGAIDRLIRLYRDTVYRTGGWLTDCGRVNLQRVQVVMQGLADVEDQIFKRRRQNDLNYQNRRKSSQGTPNSRRGVVDSSTSHSAPANHTAARELKSLLMEVPKSRGSTGATATLASAGTKRPHDGASSDEVVPAKRPSLVTAEDNVRLWEDGWRSRYYSNKFGVDIVDHPDFPQKIAHHYVRGIAWVLAYYYQGCVAWDWYFPYHYSPFARDFTNVNNVHVGFKGYNCPPNKIPFPVGEPIRPLEQLMSVFPADSRNHVPSVWHDLLTDSNSSIIDFYPTDFRVDLNGKKWLWQGVALLPFVDKKRLLACLQTHYGKLSIEEQLRNQRGSDCYFVRITHGVASQLLETHSKSADNVPDRIDPKLTNGISGRFQELEAEATKLWPCRGLVKSPIQLGAGTISRYTTPIACCQAVQVKYWDPTYSSEYVFKTALLKGVSSPIPTLKPEHFSDRGHGHQANRPDQWRPVLGFGSGPSGGGGGYRPTGRYDPRVAVRMVQNYTGGWHARMAPHQGYRAEGGHIRYGEAADMYHHSYSGRSHHPPSAYYGTYGPPRHRDSWRDPRRRQ